MLVFEFVLVILFSSVLLSALAWQIKVPYPALLALGGVVLAVIPGAPRIVLDPDLALALFLAPVLLDAAYDTSPRDLREVRIEDDTRGTRDDGEHDAGAG